MPASQARGLEFDHVVLIDPSEIATAHPGGERDLYVALSRATKRLCTLTTRSPGGSPSAGVLVKGTSCGR
ncbi:ATP-binding domain-containing protein [Streptomyces sp. NPDC001657]|uniref:ATP-binding domain-containing protein n=1 Tax=Streptomyces sp. NPDC001657 TaxID=3154522 RepID=UPI0033278625